MPDDDKVTAKDYERACAHHLFTIPWRRALGFYPAFPTSTENVRKMLAFIGIEKTVEQLESEVAAKPDGPIEVTLKRLDGTVDRTFEWMASDVLWVIGFNAK